MQKTHFGQHGDDCFGCKIQSIAIGQPSDMITRKPEVVASKRYQTQREKDMAAYRRLRKDGVVKSTQGAARLEQTASTKFELESGQVAPTASMARRLEEAQTEVKQRMAEHHKEVAASK